MSALRRSLIGLLLLAGLPLLAGCNAARDDETEAALALFRAGGAGSGAAPAAAASGLVGESPATISARLGPPLLRRPEGSAEVWLYSAGGCQLDLVFLPRGGGLRVAHAQTRAGGVAQRSESACLSEIERRRDAPPTS